jgi:AhpD family alkylhydroperoxidase
VEQVLGMEQKFRELIAIGAATTANCIPCLDFHFKKARDLDATMDEIEEAIEVGRMVRRGAARSWDKEAAKLMGNDEKGEIHDGK